MNGVQKLVDAIITAVQNAQKPTAYYAEAEVLRVEGNTAWVHIPNGVPETPVHLTIDCKKGDKVRVRVGDGTAIIIGNDSAPPTDNTEAIVAKTKAALAQTIAANARTKADAAQTAAGTAQTTAEGAQTAAENAQDTADGAQSAADGAQDTAAAALAAYKIIHHVSTTTEQLNSGSSYVRGEEIEDVAGYVPVGVLALFQTASQIRDYVSITGWKLQPGEPNILRVALYNQTNHAVDFGFTADILYTNLGVQ